jgi:hypothetical protein
MANTVGTIRQQLMRETGDFPADPVLNLAWLQSRYNSVLERCPWTFLTKEATFSTVAAITAGTVTVTNGSATVTETTSNANGWSSSVETRYFRRDGDSEFYLIDTFGNNNPDTLTLNRVYEGASGTVIGYTIFQRFYSLATDCRQIIRMAAIETPTTMEEVSQTDLDIAILNRPAEGNPQVWAQAGRDSSDNMRIELYPIPDEANGILYHYLQESPTIADDDATIIPQVDLRLLRSGWLADYWGWRAAFQNSRGNELQMSQKFEQEFERRLGEMVNRESANFPPMRLRNSASRYRHRFQSKWGRSTNNILMP